MKKDNYKDIVATYSLLGLIPPLGMLFIIVNWFKGAKINVVSVTGFVLGIVLTIVYYLQLRSQM
ncbi:MAG: hypothetical protein P0Y49_01795 [Candidatus Pedobacter colombiensis]|uniref:Uncharacterized protein n=1 Tax=Candidatus Pedobacter colombiensis TaxID=3121371 RepID=A0AAJ5WA52_9SPHI|nr:hypothetical protein [Pedobacter sp.]WEK19886.1 MAG: hypothetical protein P0Y49_01795 [Pedobacter sp.]